MLAALLCCVACSEDITTPDEWDGSSETEHSEGGVPSPDGSSFVITYSLDSEGASTRASDPNANQRIQSLDYYVYFHNGTLYKKRHIRGINTSTHWPISDRHQMTWELRQDLQDTLPDGYDYRVLFIANVNPSLYATVQDPASGGQVPQQIIRNEDDYHTARIVMPREQLKDNTMFYMWEGDIIRTDTTVPRDSTVKPQGIMLRRIVTKTDFLRQVTAPTTALPEATDAHLYKAVKEGFYTKYKATVDAAVDKQIEDFCQEVFREVINYTADDGFPFYGENGEAAQLNAFLRAHKADITAEVERKLIEGYVNKMKVANGQLWKQANPWEGMTAELIYSAEQTTGKANALGFDRKAYHLNDVTTDNSYTIGSDGQFSVVGFAGADFNHIKEIKFTDKAGAAAPFEINNFDYCFSSDQGLNTRRRVTCTPTTSVTLTSKAPTIEVTNITIDMRTLLKNAEVIPGVTFDEHLEITGEKTKGPHKGPYSVHGYMEWYVFHENHHSYQERTFGNSFSEFKFPIRDLPDLTENKSTTIDQMIEVHHTWQHAAY